MLVVHEHDSSVLKTNSLGDPYRRKIHVYVPPSLAPTSPVPALLCLTGFTGTGAMAFNFSPLQEELETRMDRLIRDRICPPAIVVAVDCFTRLGGSQYINSSAVGNYEDYLIQEIIPFIGSHYSISRWGVFGKSSGGYGAITLGMHHPDTFAAIADHSGDSNFELCYLPDFPSALDAFRESGGPRQWLEAFWADCNHNRKKYFKPLNVLAMSAHYSPNPESAHLGIDFPFDLDTGVFRPEVWARWQEWDPVRRARRYLENLKKLRLIYIDCGSKDEFGLHWGARALAQTLRQNGISCHHEEFDDGHMSITYRYDVSIPLLAKALQ